MSGRPDHDTWTGGLARFLAGFTPFNEAIGGWDHGHITEWRVACDLLCELGLAEKTDWGARPLDVLQACNPALRWDDAVIAMLEVFDRQGLIAYQQNNGYLLERPFVFDNQVFGFQSPTPAPEPNIKAGRGTGPARATEAALAGLEILHLVKDGRWTDRAEVQFWRINPAEWRLDFTADPRFEIAVRAAAAAMPASIRAAFDSALVMEPDGETGAIARPSSRSDSLEFLYHNWRWNDGWLERQPSALGAGIYCDYLAVAMHEALMETIAP